MADLPTFPLQLKGDPDAVARHLGFPGDNSHSFRIWLLWRAWPVPLGKITARNICDILKDYSVTSDLWDAFMSRDWSPPMLVLRQWFEWAEPYIIGDKPFVIEDVSEQKQMNLVDDDVEDDEKDYTDEEHPSPPPDWVWEHLSQEEWFEFKRWTHTAAGGEIANLFIRFAWQLQTSGWKKFSAEAVVNQIRWQQALKHGPDRDGYKINNNWKRRLAIWSMTRSKRLEGFFEIRNKQQEKGPGHG